MALCENSDDRRRAHRRIKFLSPTSDSTFRSNYTPHASADYSRMAVDSSDSLGSAGCLASPM